MDIAGLIQDYGYLAVAAGTFLEGESVLVLAGGAAHRGHLSLPIVILVAAIASFCGDQLNFLIGRQYGNRLLARFDALQPRVAYVKRLLERHPTYSILAIRFLYGLRVAGPIAAGMSSVSWSRFLVLNFISAAAWAVLVGCIGYVAGFGLTRLLKPLNADEWWGLALVLVAGAIWLVMRRRRPVRP